MTKAAIVGLGLYCALSGASLLGRTYWLFELLSHFRVQYALAGIVLAIFLAARRRWLWGLVAAAVVVGHAIPTLPYLSLRGSSAAEAGPQDVFRVMALNLRHRHANIDAIQALFRAERPDAVILTEFLPTHRDLLNALGKTLAYRVGTPPRGKFDSVLLSRYPIKSSQIHFPATRFLPVIEARICREPADPNSCLQVIALHASRPDFAGGRFQDQAFALVTDRIAGVADRRVVVMGDLNTTPYSHRFQDLVRRGGLTDAAIGAPWRTTWISRFPPFGLTLDHVLVGPALRPVRRRVADGIGSDHFPLIVDIVSRETATSPR